MELTLLTGMAVIGALKVMETDSIDKLQLQVAPLKYLEETLAIVALEYAKFDFAQKANEGSE